MAKFAVTLAYRVNNKRGTFERPITHVYAVDARSAREAQKNAMDMIVMDQRGIEMNKVNVFAFDKILVRETR